MRRFEDHEEVSGLHQSVVCIGNFDGLHRGHQALLTEARQSAGEDPVVVLTFHPHPAQVLAPRYAPVQITTRHDKHLLLEVAGVDGVLDQLFTLNFASLSPTDFVDRVLVDSLHARRVIVGYDFSFGRKRAGTTEMLIALGAERGFEVEVITARTVGDGLVASSTKVREFVLAGRMEAAALVLGRPFHLAGQIIQGDQRGRLLGFPTANLHPDTALLPAAGVYTGWLDVEAHGPQPAVINVGTRPTFEKTGLSIEAHVIRPPDAPALSLYDLKAHLYFERRLRDERRFDGVEALKAQIDRDREAARLNLAARKAPTPLRPLRW